MTEFPIVSLGFDATAEGATVAIAVQTDPGGPVHLECATVPAGVTEHQIQEWISEHLVVDLNDHGGTYAGDAGQPGDERPLHEIVADWTERHLTGQYPELRLAEWQREMLRAAYRDGRVTHASFISAPRKAATPAFGWWSA